jgi:hypothetical protein
MSVIDWFWRAMLGVSAASLVLAFVLFISPEFGVPRNITGPWLLVSIVCLAAAKSQSKRWAEDDDLPNYPPGHD